MAFMVEFCTILLTTGLLLYSIIFLMVMSGIKRDKSTGKGFGKRTDRYADPRAAAGVEIYIFFIKPLFRKFVIFHYLDGDKTNQFTQTNN